tara:strand:- start:3767 stop:5782 length:2016 start_codon:yes stop_codon:yes gene_type:complete
MADYETIESRDLIPRSEKAQFWIKQLDLAGKIEKDWRQQGKEIVQRYRDEDRRAAQVDRSTSGFSSRFNILWANTEIMLPAIYGSTPIPEVRRRYGDADPVGRQTAEVLERALKYVIDAYDFDSRMVKATQDYLLPGRGVTRVRYVPEFRSRRQEVSLFSPMGEELEIPENALEDDEGYYTEEEEKYYEEVVCEHVHWEDFRRGAGRAWDEVEWIAFRHLMTKDDLIEEFGATRAEKVNMNYESDEYGDDDGDAMKRGVVWEVWDKVDRVVCWIAPSFNEEALRMDEDPLGLEGFFPIPEPIMSISTTNSLIPVPEYNMYKDQAEELDLITHRINRIIGGMKLRGVFDSSVPEFDRLFGEDDNAMIPSQNGGIALQNGGMDKAIWMLPIGQHAQILQNLYIQRDQVKQIIFEVMGIADIMRGSSKASETAQAQSIKAQYGSQRMSRRMKDVEKFARNLLRLKAEIIAEHFSPESIQAMTGVQVTPEMMQLMRDEGARSFRIDIETNSTIAPEVAEDKRALNDLLQGIASSVTAITPAVQAGILPMDSAKAIIMAALRKFKMGRMVEEALDQGEMQQQQQPQQQQQDPAEQAKAMEVQAKQQNEQMRLQLEAQRIEIEKMKLQMNMQLEQQKLQQEQDLETQEMETRLRIQREKSETDLEKAEIAAMNRGNR